MGNSFGSAKKEATLLPPSMAGDIDKVKKLVGIFLASYSTPNVGHVSSDPKLQAFVNQQDPEGNNAIHGAVFAGHLEIVKYLVDGCGASLTLSNNLGCAPLWLAAGYNRVNVLEFILAKLDDPSEALLHCNSTGDTPLIAAASRGHLEACKILLTAAEKHNGLVDKLMTTGNRNDDTPLKVAIARAEEKSDELMDFLLDHAGADLNTPNKTGLTPVLVACERDDVKLLQKLLNHKADLTICDDKGASPLAVAAFCGNKEVLPILLRTNPELLEKPNTNGCTPLWLAARSGRPEVVEILLKAGADPTIQNKDNISPVDAATKFKREQVSELFEKHKV